MNAMGLSHMPSFRKTHLKPALENGLIERTIEENPNHPAQKYRLTEKENSAAVHHKTGTVSGACLKVIRAYL